MGGREELATQGRQRDCSAAPVDPRSFHDEVAGMGGMGEKPGRIRLVKTQLRRDVVDRHLAAVGEGLDGFDSEDATPTLGSLGVARSAPPARPVADEGEEQLARTFVAVLAHSVAASCV